MTRSERQDRAPRAERQDRTPRTERQSRAPRAEGQDRTPRGERQDRAPRSRPARGQGGQGSARGGANRAKAPARRKPAAAPPAEFTLPETVTPALPSVDAFADLDMPAALLKTLAAQGVTEPFPIQGATLPNSLAGRDILGRAAPAPARPSPSAWRCWPVPPVAAASRAPRSPWSSSPPASWPSRSPTR